MQPHRYLEPNWTRCCLAGGIRQCTEEGPYNIVRARLRC